MASHGRSSFPISRFTFLIRAKPTSRFPSPPLQRTVPSSIRFLWAGLVVLLLAGSGARGQATGFVRDFGFSGNYRADCWTPILVHLDSTSSQPAEYQIQV